MEQTIEIFEEAIEILNGRVNALKGELEIPYMEQAYYAALKVRIDELGIAITKLREILNAKIDNVF